MANKILKDRRLWLITIAVFAVYLTFFDSNNLVDRNTLKGQIRELEQQRDYYRQKIEQDSIVLERLKDDDFLEQYAREKYLMKREWDVVFIVTDE